MQATATKTKRVFQLRKTGSIRNPTGQQSKAALDQQPLQSQTLNNYDNNNKIINTKQMNNSYANQSFRPQSQQISKVFDTPLVTHPQITVDLQQLYFQQKIKNVQVKNIRVKNTGSCAIYYQWVFKNLPKHNPNAIKDPKPYFYCHYQPNVIKPGDQGVFSFSFYSQTPGVFVQEVEFICQPQPLNSIPPIRLKGVAYILDNLKNDRQKFVQNIHERTTQIFTREVLTDIVSQVKSPTPPLPDVNNLQIAQKQFQQKNSNQCLYFNLKIHQWFTKLYNDICDANQQQKEQRHWDQSVNTLSLLIQKVKDPILRQSFDKRLQNYKLLSSTKPPQKSDLFPKMKQILLKAGYLLGGQISDQSKKQLQMWQIPFQQPNQAQTQQQAAAKKQQKNKIIAEWAKKMKKKKWGPDQQNQMNNNYRAKLQKGLSKVLIQKLDGFDDQASFESCKAKIRQKYDPKRYFGFLQRMKTVQQFPIQGKKIFLKFDLKLKQNSEQALAKLQEYLQKKKQQQLRAEQQKKNQQSSKAKKRAPAVKKKKGQKQQEQQKVLTFDFNTLLDQESWEGFISSLKFIIQKQPYLLVIGISYGPKSRLYSQKFSVKFLLQCLKAIQPSIQFLPHNELFELRKKIQQQTLNEGSIYLTQNLSFLPCEGMQKAVLRITQKIENNEVKPIQSTDTQKMLMCQVQNELQQIMPSFDIIVREDRFSNRVSGICSYGKKTSILGLSWWKYISISLRTQGATIIFGDSFSPQKVVIISKLIKYCKQVYLVGQIGLKFWMSSTDLQSFCNYKLTKNQNSFIKQFIQNLQAQQLHHKLILPLDFVLATTKQNQTTKSNYLTRQKHENSQNTKVVDIGQQTCQIFNKFTDGHLFLFGYPSINKQQLGYLQKICKILYNKKQQKKQRHLQEQSTPAGINYEKDLVTYIVGIKQSDIDKIQLKQKKIKKSQKVEGDQQNEPQEEQQEPEPEEEIKKIDQICDFKISDLEYFGKLLAAEYSFGLKDVSKYKKSD